MSKPPDPFHEFVVELLAPMGPLKVKRMFGGAGVFASGVMFALIADDELYLKADSALSETLTAEGSEPFRFKMKDGRTSTMSYYRMPGAALDDSEEACAWGRLALDVALKAKRTR